MTLSPMTFHESYGDLPKTTLALVKRFNVSTSDFDALVAAVDSHWTTPDKTDWQAVNALIEAGSSSGIYRPSRYL